MVFLYNHGGSANHGCEALVRTTGSLFSAEVPLKLLSEAPQQDIHYGLQEIVEIYPAIQVASRISGDFIKAYLHLKRTGDYFPMDVLPYCKSIEALKKDDIEISVGGDIYCYEDYPKFIRLHELIYKKGCKSVLLGCSLEKELFDDPAFLEDMKHYDYISARESLTFGLLKEAGLDNVGLAPDLAFTLPAEYLPLPEGFQENNTVGLNLSPLAAGKESKPGITLDNYRYLIRTILEETDCSVALIPHVVWEGNDDRTILKQLFNEFKDSSRVVLIDDHNCMQLKGFIARCRFFIGARTHATIAAYSSGIPTLVLGYSLKSKGIAKDLFGTYEHYVLPVQDLQEEYKLSQAFQWLLENETEIRNHLESTMPEYISDIEKNKDIVNGIIGNQ